jgi:hypothetical protein
MKAIIAILLWIAIVAVTMGAIFIGQTAADALFASATISDKSSDIAVKSSAEYAAKHGDYSDILATVIHDGHWFVVEAHPSKGAILHHPSCPCANP